MKVYFFLFLLALLVGYFYFIQRDNPIPKMKKWFQEIPREDWTYFGLPVLLGYGLVYISVSYLSFTFQSNENFYLTFLTHPLAAFFFSVFITVLLQASFISEFAVIFAAAQLISPPIAVVLILGGNIGTCITNTVISFLNFNDRDQFQRAFAASIVHDLFNIFMVLLVLPGEVSTNFFSNHVEWLAKLFGATNTSTFRHFLPTASQDSTNTLFAILAVLGTMAGIVLIVINVRKLFLVRIEKVLKERIFTSKLKSIECGVAFTFLLQSSSISTSMIVPMVANKTVSLTKAFYFILGCNVGTAFVTLFLTLPIFLSGSLYGTAAGLTHIVFNFYGVLIFLLIPFLGDALSLIASTISANIINWSRPKIGFTLFGLYYILPIILFIICVLLGI